MTATWEQTPAGGYKSFSLCVDGWRHYHVWSNLLDQKRPKADPKDIAEAKKLYLDHRRMCTVCTPMREE